MEGKKRSITIDNVQVPMKNRLREAIFELEANISAFAEQLGISQSSLSKWLGKERAISIDLLISIYANYPKLNMDWVLTGRGAMFFTDVNAGTVLAKGSDASIKSEMDLLKDELIETQRELLKCRSGKA